MTHAVLKNLLPCPFCGKAAIVREPGSNDGFAIHIHCRCGVTMLGKRNHFSTAAEAITAWNRRAALSAMEGEAAMEILGWNDNASPRLRFLTKVDRLTAGTILYTAPSPQQAGGGNSSEVADMDGFFQQINSTPSPGPQGGGEDYKFPAEIAEWFGVPHSYPRDVRDAAEERDELLRDYVKLAKALGFAEYADFEQILAAATPPAHQPGEVDMELVEEGLRYFEMTGDKGDERYTREIRKAFAALAPKENPT